MIYAQKPNAIQLGTFDEWHDKRIGRSINKGAKSIAVIDMVNPNASIKYLFDLPDTNGSIQSYRNLQKYLWELEEQYYQEIMLRFHEKYQLPVDSIEACLYGLAGKRTKEMLPAYLEGFQVEEEGSTLYGMPEGAVKAELEKLVEESVTFTVFSKCGLQTEPFEYGSFENIQNYDSLPLFMALGNYTISIARPILKQIYQEIQDIKNERSKIYEERTIDGLHLSDRQRWDAVPANPDFRGYGNQPDARGKVWRDVEEIHDGGTPKPTVRVGGTGESQRDNPAGGQRSGTAEGRTDTGTTDQISDAGNRGHNGTGRASGDAYEAGGGNRDKRSSNAHPVIPQAIQPPKDGFRPSAGGFFVPPKRELRQEIEPVPVKGDLPQEALQPEGWEPEVKSQSSMEKQKTTVQRTEESTRLVDMVLCADDIVPEAKEWQKEIAEYFQGDYEPYLKAHTLRIFYRGMNQDYTTKDRKHHLRITGDEEKLTIQENEDEISYSYERLAGRINEMLQDGRYPSEDIKEKEDIKNDGMGRKQTTALGEGEKKEAGQQWEINPTAGMVQNDQLSLFDMGIQNSYEDIGGADDDAMLDRERMQVAVTIGDSERRADDKTGANNKDIEKTNTTVTKGSLQTDETIIEERIYEPEGTTEVTQFKGQEEEKLSDQSTTNRNNYHFSEDHHLYDGGAKTKCQNNIAAIQLLKELQSQNRMATGKEQITLAKFVGWGGLANALTPGKSGWETQYQEIKHLLTEDEFQAAQENTLTAYYTEQGIICHIYDALGQFGFRGGNILDITVPRLIQRIGAKMV